MTDPASPNDPSERTVKPGAQPPSTTADRPAGRPASGWADSPLWDPEESPLREHPLPEAEPAATPAPPAPAAAHLATEGALVSGTGATPPAPAPAPEPSAPSTPSVPFSKALTTRQMKTARGGLIGHESGVTPPAAPAPKAAPARPPIEVVPTPPAPHAADTAVVAQLRVLEQQLRQQQDQQRQASLRLLAGLGAAVLLGLVSLVLGIIQLRSRGEAPKETVHRAEIDPAIFEQFRKDLTADRQSEARGRQEEFTKHKEEVNRLINALSIPKDPPTGTTEPPKPTLAAPKPLTPQGSGGVNPGTVATDLDRKLNNLMADLAGQKQDLAALAQQLRRESAPRDVAVVVCHGSGIDGTIGLRLVREALPTDPALARYWKHRVAVFLESNGNARPLIDFTAAGTRPDMTRLNDIVLESARDRTSEPARLNVENLFVKAGPAQQEWQRRVVFLAGLKSAPPAGDPWNRVAVDVILLERKSGSGRVGEDNHGKWLAFCRSHRGIPLAVEVADNVDDALKDTAQLDLLKFYLRRLVAPE